MKKGEDERRQFIDDIKEKRNERGRTDGNVEAHVHFLDLSQDRRMCMI